MHLIIYRYQPIYKLLSYCYSLELYIIEMELFTCCINALKLKLLANYIISSNSNIVPFG